MSLNQSTAPLSVSDIEKLNGKRILMSFILIGVFVVFAIVAYFIGWQSNILVFKIFASVFVLFPLAMIVVINFSFIKDKKNGTKIITKGIVTDKSQKTVTTGTSKNRSVSTYFYVFIDNEKFEIEGKYYNMCFTGDKIELQQAAVSQSVLDFAVLDKIQNSSLKTPVDNFFNTNNYFSERIESLTDDEIAAVKQKRNKKVLSSLIISGVLGFVGYWVFLLIFVLLFAKLNIKMLHVIDTLVYTIIGGFILLIFYKRVLPFQKDLNENQKIITSSRIGNKAESNVKITSNSIKITSRNGDFRYLVVNKNYFPVSQSLYNSTETGDEVFVHTAKNSKMILAIYDSKNKVLTSF
jgi:hypothetical protein